MQRSRKRRHMVHRGGHTPLVAAIVEGWLPAVGSVLHVLVQFLGVLYAALRLSELGLVRRWWRIVRRQWKKRA